MSPYARAILGRFVAFLLFLLFCFAVITHLWGCAPATRAEARGAILATTQAVKIGDETCAKYALERADIQLARVCEHAYDVARASLIVASAGVDAWEEGKRDSVTCAIVHAADELTRTAAELRQRNIKVPPVVDDSLRLAGLLGGCHD